MCLDTLRRCLIFQWNLTTNVALVQIPIVIQIEKKEGLTAAPRAGNPIRETADKQSDRTAFQVVINPELRASQSGKLFVTAPARKKKKKMIPKWSVFGAWREKPHLPRGPSVPHWAIRSSLKGAKQTSAMRRGRRNHRFSLTPRERDFGCGVLHGRVTDSRVLCYVCSRLNLGSR